MNTGGDATARIALDGTDRPAQDETELAPEALAALVGKA
jgi:hypothetical protein